VDGDKARPRRFTPRGRWVDHMADGRPPRRHGRTIVVEVHWAKFVQKSRMAVAVDQFSSSACKWLISDVIWLHEVDQSGST